MLGAVAGEPGVHVVGGAVRDALLGRMPAELDLVVEGDAEPVARRAAERLGGEVTVHERFGTATVHAPPAVFDVTSARAETYPAPGALPEVRLGVRARRGSRPARLQRQRDRHGRGRRAPDRIPGGVRGPRGGRAAGPPRRVVPGRPDPAAAARPLRGAARLRRRGAHRRRWPRPRSLAARSTPSAGSGWAQSCGCSRASRSRARWRRSPASGSARRCCPASPPTPASSRGRWRWRPRTPAAT